MSGRAKLARLFKLNNMNDDKLFLDLIDKTKELVAIESTAKNIKGLRQAYDLMVKFLNESGKEITIEEFESNGRPSLLAYQGSKRPARFDVILNGHLDVVPGKPEQYKAAVRNGKLYGRGTYDMKAASLVLAQVFCEYVDKVSFDLGLQLVTDEESAGKNGTIYQIKEGVRSNFVICGECGRAEGTYEIANQAKGVIVVEIGFSGKRAHGAYPWKGNNAAIRANNFISGLHDIYPIPEEHTENTTVSVTSISSLSDAPNQIPDQAIVKFDFRYRRGEPNFKNKVAFARFIKSIDPEAEIVQYLDFSSPLYSDPNNSHLKILIKAAQSVEDKKFELVQRNATSDGRFFGDVGVQACEFGIAGEHQHADNEYISLKAFRNYLDTIRTYLDLEQGEREKAKKTMLQSTVI